MQKNLVVTVIYAAPVLTNLCNELDHRVRYLQRSWDNSSKNLRQVVLRDKAIRFRMVFFLGCFGWMLRLCFLFAGLQVQVSICFHRQMNALSHVAVSVDHFVVGLDHQALIDN